VNWIPFLYRRGRERGLAARDLMRRHVRHAGELVTLRFEQRTRA
jgi:hypothetical protein